MSFRGASREILILYEPGFWHSPGVYPERVEGVEMTKSVMYTIRTQSLKPESRNSLSRT